MNGELTPMERRLRLAAELVLLGLVVEGLTLAWHHPLSFIVFMGLGGLLLAAGIIVFLLSLVSVPHSETRASD